MIKVSEKYGVNPSVTSCFWCGKDKGLVMFGRLKGDVEAPRTVCMDYEPCKECIKNFSMGMLIIECSTNPCKEGQVPLTTKPQTIYPTGRYSVINVDAFRKWMCKLPDLDKIIESGRLCIDRAMFEKYIIPAIGEQSP